MNICKRCGKENQEHYKFCLGCGGELTSSAPAMGGGAQKTMMAQALGPGALSGPIPGAPSGPMSSPPLPGVPPRGASPTPPAGMAAVSGPGFGEPTRPGSVPPIGPPPLSPAPLGPPPMGGPSSPAGASPFGGGPSSPPFGSPQHAPMGGSPPFGGAAPMGPSGARTMMAGSAMPAPGAGAQVPAPAGWGTPGAAPSPPPLYSPPAGPSPVLGGVGSGPMGSGGSISGSQPAVAIATRPCSNCGTEVPATFVFCGACGTRLEPMPAGGLPGGDVMGMHGRTGMTDELAAQPPPIVEPKPRGRLTLIRPDGSEGGSHDLEEGENQIGRSHGPLFENDGYLSPRHAEIVINAAGAVIRDLDSLNGVFVKMTTEEELASGDVMRIGQELLRFDAISPPQPLEDGTEVMGSPNPGYWGRLSVIIGKDIDGSAYPLFGDAMTVGRERGDINFPDDGYVSGVHARISNRDGKTYLVDLGSSNGTFIRLRGERTVQDGFFVLFGQQLFRMNLTIS